MEPVTFLFKIVAVAFLSAVPAPPSTVPGTVEMTYVSNTSVIKQSAEVIKLSNQAAAKTAQEIAEQAAKETSEEDKAAKIAEKENLHLPLKAGSYVYTSDYGPRCAPISGVPLFHDGMDLAAPLGTPLYAFADGVVVKVVDGVNDVTTNGGQVTIESTIDGQKITYTYRHMENSSKYVKVGDQVKAGQHISNVASTGHSTGSHLHLEILEGTMKDGKHINPADFFKKVGLKVIEGAKATYVSGHDSSECSTSPVTKTPSVIGASTTTKTESPSDPANIPAPSPKATPTKTTTPVTPAPVKTQEPVKTPAPVVPVVPTVPSIPVPAPSSIPSLVPTLPTK